MNLPANQAGVEKIDQEIRAITDLASNRVRTIAGGVALFIWSIVITPQNKIAITIEKKQLLMPVLLAIISLLADLLQYAFNYLELYRRRSRILDQLSVEGWPGFYIMSILLFISKVALMTFSAVWLVIVLGRLVLKG